MNTKAIVSALCGGSVPSKQELAFLLDNFTDSDAENLRAAAQEKAKSVFGNRVFIRGLIEFSSVCKRDCLYCGLRRSNQNAVRYRHDKQQILSCCDRGYALGFRTFVLQSGEDGYFTDEIMCDIVSEIRASYPDCAITLSLGERGYDSFKRLFEAGADRYLLRHETADPDHYAKLHPPGMTLETRLRSLEQLKELGYQTGAGFMVGSPGQTAETLAEDLLFLKRFDPQMCGIGPFIPHKDTPFANEPAGTLRMTLILLSIVRLLLPRVLLPSTTALGTIDPKGRELGILHGANVVMPNLSPVEHRKDYSLYDNKICTGDEAAECIRCLSGRMERIGYQIVTERGDYK